MKIINALILCLNALPALAEPTEPTESPAIGDVSADRNPHEGLVLHLGFEFSQAEGLITFDEHHDTLTALGGVLGAEYHWYRWGVFAEGALAYSKEDDNKDDGEQWTGLLWRASLGMQILFHPTDRLMLSVSPLALSIISRPDNKYEATYSQELQKTLYVKDKDGRNTTIYFSPRLGLEYFLNDHFSLYLASGVGYSESDLAYLQVQLGAGWRF